MPGAVSTEVLATPNARESVAYCALVANGTAPASYPTPVDVEIATGSAVTGAATAQAITITSVSLPIAMQVGQYLTFRDAAGSYLFEVTTLAASGTTTEITGIAIEDIPAGATAQFPEKFYLATQLDTTETTGTTTFATFDHAGTSETARGESTQSISSGAGDSYYNGGLQTLVYAQRNSKDVFFGIELPNPDADAFSTPPIEWCVGKVTDVSAAGGVNDKRTRTVNIAVDGGFRSVRPVAAS